MSEMVKRVAKVMCDMQHGHGAYDAHQHLRCHFSMIAAAGIEAMREPTEEMCGAWDVSPQPEAKPCWQAMIDAALSRS